MTTGDLRSNSRRRREIVVHMDMIEDILTRLPVKHVLQCKLLSKTYNDLIKKKSFINKHRLQHQSDHRVVVVTKNPHDSACNRLVSTLSAASDSLIFSLPLPGPFSNSDYARLVGSCNGLLLLHSLVSGNFTICNPATREYKSLPRPKSISQEPVIGFGYDSKYDDYVIVDIRHSLPKPKQPGSQSYWIETWNMSTNTWKQINPSIPSLFSGKNYWLSDGCLVMGTLYWLAFTEDRSDGNAAILSFDLSSKTIGKIALPKEIVGRHDIHELKLVDFKSSLAFSIAGLPFGESHRWLDIWVKASDDSFWTKRFKIGPLPLDVWSTLVCIDGNLVLRRLIPPCSGPWSCELMLFDPRCNKVVKESSHNDFSAFGITACSMSESLVSIPHPCKQ